MQSSQQIGNVSVYNVLGQEVLSTTAGFEKQLNITQLQPGFYFIKTRLGTQRIIKT